MPVAKSYTDFPQLCEPYEEKGRLYVLVKSPKGEKKVRWYSDKEYARMYPDSILVSKKKSGNNYKPQKEALGFQKGYVTIFKGDTYSHLEWFRASICRYHKWWGWYVVSTEQIPEDLPKDLTALRLEWDKVCSAFDNDELSENEAQVKEYIDTLMYEPTSSQFVGEVGERLDLILTVVKAIELTNGYGNSTMHIFEDADGNTFVWTTASKSLAVNTTYSLRGTVKDHKIYRNSCQTILTRCGSIKEV